MSKSVFGKLALIDSERLNFDNNNEK